MSTSSRGSSAEPSRRTPPRDEASSLWARPVTTASERATARARRMAEGLPAWEPLPPGEVVVRRRSAG